MKVSELEGEQLDYWVAKAEGIDEPYIAVKPASMTLVGTFAKAADVPRGFVGVLSHKYSRDWRDAGPIIEREGINLGVSSHRRTWRAFGGAMAEGEGKTPLIAAMRCYVAMKFGDEVPDER